MQGETGVADRDITCWKMVEILSDRDGERVYVTPYMFKYIPETVLEGKYPFRTGQPDYTYELCRGLCNRIFRGFIHTYAIPTTDDKIDAVATELKYAITSVNSHESYMTVEKLRGLPNCDLMPWVIGIALYRCVIPKGAEYLEGSSDGLADFRCYASREIVFKEKVAEWNDKYCPDMKERIISVINGTAERGIPL